jgi:hypothetical protein
VTDVKSGEIIERGVKALAREQAVEWDDWHQARLEREVEAVLDAAFPGWDDDAEEDGMGTEAEPDLPPWVVGIVLGGLALAFFIAWLST